MCQYDLHALRCFLKHAASLPVGIAWKCTSALKPKNRCAKCESSSDFIFFEALGWLGISKTHWHTMMPDLRQVMFNFGGGRCASMICMPWGDLLEAWGDSWMTVCHAGGVT